MVDVEEDTASAEEPEGAVGGDVGGGHSTRGSLLAGMFVKHITSDVPQNIRAHKTLQACEVSSLFWPTFLHTL